MSNTLASDSVAVSRSARLFRVALLAAIVFGVFWLGVTLLLPPPSLVKANREAAELQARLRRQPQFAEVEVDASTNGKLVVRAPGAFSDPVKAELESIVSRHAPKGTVPVAYMYTVVLGTTHPK